MGPGMSRMWRELTATAVLAWVLAAGPVVSRNHQVATLVGAAVLAFASVVWVRFAHERLLSRVALVSVGGMFSFAGFALGAGKLGATTLVLAIVLAAASVAVTDCLRLRGAPLPPHGDPRGRVAFEGTIHPVGAPARLPGDTGDTAMWVAQQGEHRWSSDARAEIRDEQRRVWLDPQRARVRGASWRPELPLSAEIAHALTRVNAWDQLDLWRIPAGTAVYVVGTAALVDDEARPSYRDPAQISLFSGDLVIGVGRLASVRRRALARLMLASGIALAASGLALAGAAGWW